MQSKKCPNAKILIQIWLKTHIFDSNLWGRGTFLTPCVRALKRRTNSEHTLRKNQLFNEFTAFQDRDLFSSRVILRNSAYAPSTLFMNTWSFWCSQKSNHWPKVSQSVLRVINHQDERCVRFGAFSSAAASRCHRCRFPVPASWDRGGTRCGLRPLLLLEGERQIRLQESRGVSLRKICQQHQLRIPIRGENVYASCTRSKKKCFPLKVYQIKLN